MTLEDYKKQRNVIMSSLTREIAYARYIKLMEVFVQDSALAGEEFYGNKTIAKAKILFNLQRYFFIERKAIEV